MSPEPRLEHFMSCPDMASAVVVAEYLRLRECPAIALPDPPGFELRAAAEVRVPSEFLHRARWFWSLADAEDLSAGEIEYLATGKLPGATSAGDAGAA